MAFNPHAVKLSSLLSAFIFFVSAALFAEETAEHPPTYRLTGNVVNNNTREPVSDALISAGASDTALRSDSDGMFFWDIPSGSTCTLTVTKDNYEATVVPIASGLQDTTITILLKPAALPELPKMVVSSNRIKTRQTLDISENVGKLTITPELVADLPNQGQSDLFRSLQLLPGVNGTNEASSGLFIRGGTPDQNLVILDNMPIYYVDHFYGFFSTFNPRAIDKVTIYKGGFGPQWGGRLSSVVELTSSGSDPQSNPETITGSVGAGLLCSDGYLRIPIKKGAAGTIMVAGRRSMTDRFASDLFNAILEGVHKPDTLISQSSAGFFNPFFGINFPDSIPYMPDFFFWDVNALATFNLGAHGKLSTTVFASSDRQSYSIDSGWVSDTVVYPDFEHMTLDTIQDSLMPYPILIPHMRMDSSNTGIALRTRDNLWWGNRCVGEEWEQKWGDLQTTRVNVSYSQFFDKRKNDLYRADTQYNRYDDDSPPFDTSYSAVSGLASVNTITDFSLRFSYSVRPADWNTLNAGFELSRKNVIYERDSTKPDTTVPDWQYKYDPFGGLSKPYIISRDTSLSGAMYVEDELRFGGRGGVQPGLRLYFFDLASAYAFDPRISGWYNLLPELQLKAAWGMYTQEIHRVEEEDIMGGSKYIWLMANKDRPLEKSRNAIGGISWHTGNFYMDVEGYHKQLSGLLTISERLRQDGMMMEPFDPNEFPLFKGTGTVKGIDFIAQARNVRFPLFSRKTTYNGWAAYTLSRTENTFSVFNDGKPFPAKYDRPHEVKLVNTLEWDVTNWSSINIGAVWMYSTGTPYTAPLGEYTIRLLDEWQNAYYTSVSEKNNYRLPDYHRLDLSVSLKLRLGSRIKSTLSAGIFNAYNNKNIVERTYTQSYVYNDLWSRGIMMDPTAFDPKMLEPVTIYTAIDKQAMSVMPTMSFELSAEF